MGLTLLLSATGGVLLFFGIWGVSVTLAAKLLWQNGASMMTCSSIAILCA